MTRASEREWVVLFGGPNREDALLAFARNGIIIKAILVPEIRNERLQAGIDRLRGIGAPIIDVRKDRVEAAIRPWTGCALLSIGFPYILPPVVLERHNLRLNIHPTLLPKYRGPTTGSYILINGEKESGSTVHVLDEEMDKGDIVAQSKVVITRFDTVRSLQRKVYATEPDLILEAIRCLDAGIPPVPQDETQASVFPKKRKPEDSRIDPSKRLEDLIDEIRACDPDAYPAFFEIEGQKVAIRLWRPDRPEGESDAI